MTNRWVVLFLAAFLALALYYWPAWFSDEFSTFEVTWRLGVAAVCIVALVAIVRLAILITIEFWRGSSSS